MEVKLRMEPGPETLGMLELTSIARGIQVADLMVKCAPISVLEARPHCPGKFLIIVTGEVAGVQEAIETGIAASRGVLFGHLMIPNLASAIIPAINRDLAQMPNDTVAVVETFSAASAVDGADAAVKNADVLLHSVNLLDGLGGKAYFIAAGAITDVEAAVEAATVRIPADMLVEAMIVPQISGEIVSFFPGALGVSR